MKLPILLLLTLLLEFPTYAQSARSEIPLKLHLAAKNSSACLDESHEFLARLKNISRQPVIVDVHRIGSSASFEFIRDNSVSMGFGTPYGSHYKPDLVILQPGETYSAPTHVDFKSDHFSKTGRYTMQIWYKENRVALFEKNDAWQGTVRSNKITLDVRNCERKSDPSS
jgi:hypothetical protein